VNLLSDFAVEQLARPTSGPQNAIAVVDGERSVTYDELDRAADQVANGLKARGLGNGGRVAFVGRNGLADFTPSSCPTSSATVNPDSS
jgi:non-ribosomal peptide synthetase component E (peptide arylation enzyme)